MNRDLVLAGAEKKKSRKLGRLFWLIVFCVLTYFTTGFFVIQPIGTLPDGATVWYWRIGTSMPFVSSADGLLLESEGKVSLFGRALALGAVAKPVAERKIMSLPYSVTLYRISTGGKEFDR